MDVKIYCQVIFRCYLSEKEYPFQRSEKKKNNFFGKHTHFENLIMHYYYYFILDTFRNQLESSFNPENVKMISYEMRF